MSKKIPFIIIIVFIIALLGYVIKKQNPKVETLSDKVSVATSFYPLYLFTKTIGGENAFVINLTPAGVEPHDYEPSTQDIATIEKAQILVVNGNSFEPWFDRIDTIIRNKDIHVVMVSKDLVKEEDGAVDPHVWLDPHLAKEIVSEITKAFNEVDPHHMIAYGTNADELQRKLIELDEEFQKGLSSCKQKNIVTSHSAFGYLATRYGFTQVALSGISPDEEPSARKMVDITKFIKDTGIKHVFFEELVSPKIAETLAKETGAQTLTLNPLEGLTKEEEEKGEDYFSIQRKNLTNLKIALECTD